MASFIADVFEADVFEDAIFTGVNTDVVKEFEVINKIIRLKEGVISYNPIDDLYKEMRFHRKHDESLRVKDVPIVAEGNLSKGGGIFTGRLAIFKDGWVVVPADSPLNPVVTITGEQIDGLGLSGLDLVDTTGLVNNVNMNYVPPPTTEVVQLNIEAIQYSSYQNGVWIDVNSDNGGVDFPSGTREFPVNNVQHAVQIASTKGFDTLFILGSLTLGLGDDVSNLTIRGNNPLTSILTVLPDANTTNLYVRGLYFTGALDGGSIIRDCVVGAIDYFNGYLEHCAITSSTIKFNGSASLLNCRAGAGSDIYPKFDLTNATDVSIWGYEGQAEFINCANPIHVDITMTGSLKIATSVTDGEFHIHGDCSVEHTQTGTEVVNDETTGNPIEIANEVWNKLLP